MWKWFAGACLLIIVLSCLVTYWLGQGVPAEVAANTSRPRAQAAAVVEAEGAGEQGGGAAKVGTLSHAQEHLTRRVRPVKQEPMTQGILPQ